MLIGMALFRCGVLSGEKSRRWYAGLALLGLGIGTTLTVIGVAQNEAHDWKLMYSFFLGPQYNNWGSIFTCLGYVGVISAFRLTPNIGRWLDPLTAVGRMALTNYIAQTVICTTVFYGHGLGYFGYFDRFQLWMFVVAIWAVQLAVSPWWLRRFCFGPLEWLWRSLTYRKCQPMRPGTVSS